MRDLTTMRVTYNYLSESLLDDVFSPFKKNYGGGLDDISFYRPQVRGGNIFGVVGNLFRKAFPIIKSLILPELGTFSKNLTHDYGENGNFRNSLKKNLINSGKNIGRRIIGGKRTKTNCRKKCNSKKKRKNPPKNRSKTDILKNKNKRKNTKKNRKRVNDIFNSNEFTF